MYPLGHFGLAYFLVTLVRRFIGEDYSLPVIFVASVLPDVDVLFSAYLVHRGPTHSVVVMTVLFVPVYLCLRRGLPYYFALLSHSLIGDYFTAYGVQLFWPLSEDWYRASSILRGVELAGVEYGLFTLMLIHMAYTRLYKKK